MKKKKYNECFCFVCICCCCCSYFCSPFFSRLKAVTHRENKQPGLPPPYFTKQQQQEKQHLNNCEFICCCLFPFISITQVFLFCCLLFFFYLFLEIFICSSIPLYIIVVVILFIYVVFVNLFCNSLCTAGVCLYISWCLKRGLLFNAVCFVFVKGSFSFCF